MPKASTSLAKIDRSWLAAPAVLAMTARARGLYATLIGIADDNGTVPMKTLKRNWPANPNRYLPELRKADLIIDSDDAVTVRALARLRRRHLIGQRTGDANLSRAFLRSYQQQEIIRQMLDITQSRMYTNNQDVPEILAADFVTRHQVTWDRERSPSIADQIPTARRLITYASIGAVRRAIERRCRPDLPPSQSLLECCAHLLPPDQAARHAA